MNIKKITPFLILLSLALLVLIPFTFYYLFIENKGGMALAGILAGFASAGIALILLLERSIVRNINYKVTTVCIVESAILLLALIFFLFSNSKLYYKVSDNVQWFAIVQSGDKTDKQITYSFPNDRVMNVDINQVLRLKSKDIGNRSTDVTGSGKLWDGYKAYNKFHLQNGEKVNYTIYTSYNYVLTDSDYTSISEQLGQLK